MTGCERAALDLGAVMSGEADPVTTRRLEDHLGACASCTREAGSVNEALGVLACEEPPEPGALYWTRFEERLRRRVARAVRRRRAGRLSAAAAAMAAGLAILSLWSGRRRVEEPSPPPVGAPAVAGDPEARLDQLIARAARDEEGRRLLRSLLEEVAPGDPTELDDAYETLTPEEGRRLLKEFAGTEG